MLNQAVMTDLEVLLKAPLGVGGEEWEVYVDEACGDDAGLREAVRSLRAAWMESASFLERADLPEEPPAPEPSRMALEFQRKGEGDAGKGTAVSLLVELQAGPARRGAPKVKEMAMNPTAVIAMIECARQRCLQDRSRHSWKKMESKAESADRKLLPVEGPLKKLKERHALAAKVVGMHYLSAIPLAMVAEVLDLPPWRVDRLWEVAKAWIYRETSQSRV